MYGLLLKIAPPFVPAVLEINLQRLNNAVSGLPLPPPNTTAPPRAVAVLFSKVHSIMLKSVDIAVIAPPSVAFLLYKPYLESFSDVG